MNKINNKFSPHDFDVIINTHLKEKYKCVTIEE
jgi:hypothetical protein